MLAKMRATLGVDGVRNIPDPGVAATPKENNRFVHIGFVRFPWLYRVAICCGCQKGVHKLE